MADRFMDIEEAFEIVLELAQQNVIDQNDESMEEESKKQNLAIDTVQDFVTNNILR